jgi:hypothetical protein
LISWRRCFGRRASGPVWQPPASQPSRRRIPPRGRFPRRFGLPHRRPPLLRRRDDPPAPPGLRRRFFRAAIAGAGDAGAATFRPAAQRFLCAAARRRRAATLTMRLDASEAVAGAGDEPSSRWSLCW